MPKVSIIMGAFNCADTITCAIQSLQYQDFKDWELVVCDDCSTDSTYEVISNLAEEDSRIVVIKNEQNCRLAATLNHCLQHARGKYIARMDSDDICMPDRLSAQVNCLDEHPDFAVVGGGVLLYDEAGDHEILLSPEFPDVKYMYRHIPFFHPTIMMRREIYEALDGYVVAKRTRRGQDMDMWFRFFAAGYKGYNLQRVVLKYHDSLSDIKKKNSMSAAWGFTQTLFLGFKANKFPLYKYVWIAKPIVVALFPQSIIFKMHKLFSK